LTLIFKAIFPLAVMVAFAVSVSWAIAGAGPRDVVYSGVWLIGLGFVLWTCGPLKHVSIDQTELCVSGFLRKMRVPLANIADVSENRWLNVRPIRVRFDIKTPFGNSIVFVPEPRWGVGMRSPHPIVAELRALAAKNQETKDHASGRESPQGRAPPDQRR